MSTEPAEAATEHENFEEMLGSDNVQRLHGNLYRVRRVHIDYGKQGVNNSGGGIKFGNPRWITNAKGKPIARGLDRQKMEDLKSSIREEGLENPLRLRIIDDGDKCFLEVVNGERRLRSIDSLVSENAMCVDPAHPDQPRKSAKDLFEWVEVRINRLNERDALKIALRPNETGESIGELATIQVVKLLRGNGCDDEEILEITGKSVTWLRETDKLINLDPACLQALQQEEINRKVALTLTEIKDVGNRLTRLEEIRAAAIVRIANKEKALLESKQTDEMAAEIEAATASLADRDGDSEAAEEHRKKAAEAAARAAKKAAEVSAIKAQPKTATVKDLDKTRPKPSDDQTGPKSWTAKKIEKFWLGPLSETIRNKGLDEDGNDLEVDVNDCRLVAAVLKAMIDGKKSEDNTPIDIHKILRSHRDKK